MLLSCTLWVYCGVGSILPTFRVDNFDVIIRAYTSRNKVSKCHVHLTLKKLCRKSQHHVQLRQSSQKIRLLLKGSHSLVKFLALALTRGTGICFGDVFNNVLVSDGQPHRDNL